MLILVYIGDIINGYIIKIAIYLDQIQQQLFWDFGIHIELATLIYRRSIKYLFGPVLGKIFKNSTLLLKPKIGHIETYFNW